MAQGSSVAVELLLRARGSVSWQRDPPDGSRLPGEGRAGGEGAVVEVMFERVAGLDVGKESVTVCLRTPGPGGRRRSETRTFQDDVCLVAGDAGLAGRERGRNRGDGVDVDVLEGAVLLPGGSDGDVAAERGPHESGAGPQVGCAGGGVDRAAVGARLVGAVVRTPARHPPVANADPLSDPAAGGPDPGHDAVGVDVGRRLDQVVLGRVEPEYGVGGGDAWA
jgi:hypothetical protein